MVQAGVDEEEVGQVQEESLGTIYGGRFGKVDGWQQYPPTNVWKRSMSKANLI